jgi:uncharacterized protein
MECAITHEEQAHRFICMDEGHECTVEYEQKNNVMEIYRTFVHPDLRGRGIAEKLMLAAIDYAQKNSLSIFPSCSYAVTFFRRHPEHGNVLDKNSDLENGGSCRLPGRN